MQGEQQIAKLHMERNLVFLGTVGNNAPFVGLLGTVIGIIRAFHSLDESQGKVTAGLMADVGEALVATAIGIMVALPAVAAFNYFQREIKTRQARGSALGSHVLSYLMSPRANQTQAAEYRKHTRADSARGTTDCAAPRSAERHAARVLAQEMRSQWLAEHPTTMTS
jgi:biopolymer transport protein ExbB